MKNILTFSVLLVLGLLISQLTVFLPQAPREVFEHIVKNLTLICLAFIMIHVGLEFTINKTKLASYGWDYFVAFTAATFPWIFCSLYFVFSYDYPAGVDRSDIWTDALLLGRFASPTSAGVLFAMLAAAGLEASWMFKKARILAIFDDLDTIILLIPLKMMIIGFRFELIILLMILGGLIYLAWKKLHSVSLPLSWHYIMLYSIIITFLCEGIYFLTDALDSVSPVQVEILLPAFVLGCILAYPKNHTSIHKFLEQPVEHKMKVRVSALFMLLVGASMPAIGLMHTNSAAEIASTSIWDYNIGGLTVSRIIWDVVILTILSNLGKMFPVFCYRKEASLEKRLALAIGMCPRGEVGAGVIIVSLGLITHLSQGAIIVAMLSLTVNLVLTGPFIMRPFNLEVRQVKV